MILERLLRDAELLEREHFTRDEAHALERLVSRLAAVERYRIVRKYARGSVVDAACGCGFGSSMLARCPAVSRVLGLDSDDDAVGFARREYAGASVRFELCDLQAEELVGRLRTARADTVVSIETLEHLADPGRFVAAVTASPATRLIATFPSFATSAFNPYHLTDLTLSDLSAMVGRTPAKAWTIGDAVQVAVFDLP
ncbi:MAG TPA: class I SAM-dependent methyltransferase [Thermoanaerobaculia bacterium]|nr:class I SAM-dependent methyltransferase [Thermoleophilia bacterium]HRS37349.1 class I SAM-dependent methyltransferase [Thermoanaerobaculia bacterium]